MSKHLSARTRDEVVAEVSAKRRVRSADILSESRAHHLAHARQQAMWRLHKLGYSLPQIGRVFGRDHTTVLFAVRQHEKRMASQ